MAKHSKPAIDVNSGKQVQIDRPEATLCYFDGQGRGWVSPQAHNELSPEEKAKRAKAKADKSAAWAKKREASRQHKTTQLRERAARAQALAAKLEQQATQAR